MMTVIGISIAEINSATFGVALQTRLENLSVIIKYRIKNQAMVGGFLKYPNYFAYGKK